jgi:predicted transcriptional regulator
MALEGSLMDFGLADILQLIYFQKKTGLLSLNSEKDRVRLMFYEGNVISAESRKRVEENRIGKILLKKGLINEDDLKSSLEEQKTTGVRLGEILLKSGLVRKEDISETLVSQMTETVVQLFSWKDGTYEFQAQTVTLNKEMPVTLDTQHLLMDGLRILDEWSLVEGKITLDTVFRRTGETEPTLSSEEENILKFVDGESDVSIIIEVSGVDDFEASKILVSLLDRGIIERVTVSPVITETAAALHGAKESTFTRALYPVLFLIALVVSLIGASLQEAWSERGLVVFLGGDSLKRVKTAKEIDELRFMAEAYKYRNGSYPVQLEEVGNGKDTWGRPYSYHIENGILIILSAGPDGRIGTADDIY